MQVGVEDLAVAQLHPFARLRLLDLDDHVRLGEHLCGRLGDRGAGGAVGIVVGADAGAGARLDQHFVAVRDIFAHRAGVRPTRYSWFLISFGQPTRIRNLSSMAVPALFLYPFK
jgi:hypothetical protein